MRYLKYVISIIPFFFYINAFAVEEPVIAVVKSRDIAPYNTALRGFNQALKEEGIGASVVEYDIKGNKTEGLPVIEELKLRKPQLVLTLGSLATEMVQENIKDIPTVFSMVLNPVASGFVESMESSGNNLTGASMDIPIRYQFENLKRAVPKARKIGVIYNPKETGAIIEEALRKAKEMGLELVDKPVGSEKEVPEAIKEIGEKIDALWAVADSTVFNLQSTQFIILYTLRSKISFMAFSPSYVKAGALLALSCDDEDIGRQAGELAAKVLTGHRPKELPITTPRKISLSLNLKVAEEIGIVIPSDVVSQAKVVFR